MPADPEVAEALRQIEDWVRQNDWADFLEPSRLRQDLADISPAGMALALEWLVCQGLLIVRYRPISPYTHQVVSFDFEEPTASGKTVRDSLDQAFPADEAEFVQVFIEP